MKLNDNITMLWNVNSYNNYCYNSIVCVYLVYIYAKMKYIEINKNISCTPNL